MCQSERLARVSTAGTEPSLVQYVEPAHGIAPSPVERLPLGMFIRVCVGMTCG